MGFWGAVPVLEVHSEYMGLNGPLDFLWPVPSPSLVSLSLTPGKSQLALQSSSSQGRIQGARAGKAGGSVRERVGRLGGDKLLKNRAAEGSSSSSQERQWDRCHSQHRAKVRPGLGGIVAVEVVRKRENDCYVGLSSPKAAPEKFSEKELSKRRIEGRKDLDPHSWAYRDDFPVTLE